MYSLAPLKKDIHNAQKVLWWKLALEFFVVALPALALSEEVHTLVLLASATTLCLFSYLLFRAFAQMAKHFHKMNLFWFLVAQFAVGIIFLTIDTVMRLSGGAAASDTRIAFSGIVLLFGAVMTFGYGYFIMELPHVKFGKLLLRARAMNMALAFVMTFAVFATSAPASSPFVHSIESAIGIFALILIFVTNFIDYAILGRALALLGDKAPTTKAHARESFMVFSFMRVTVVSFLLATVIVTLLGVFTVNHHVSESVPYAPPLVQISDGVRTLSVELAATAPDRERGLSQHAPLHEGEGMLFVFDSTERHGFWMPDMAFAIDIIWMDESGRIIAIKENATPASYPEVFSPKIPSRFVLEIGAHVSQKWGWKEGTQLHFNTAK